jgi:hypothetical protein
VKDRFIAFFRGLAERVRLRIFGAAEIVPPPVKAPARQDRAAEIEETGRWYFKRNILDQLDDYFRCIRKMRALDPDSYALYSKVGAVIWNRAADAMSGGEWLARPERIAFGAVHMNHAEKIDKYIYPAFVYFNKYDKPNPRVEPAPECDVYLVTCFFVDRRKSRPLSAAPAQWHVAVSRSGSARLLRSATVTAQHIPVRTSAAKRRMRGGRQSTVYHLQWSSPQFLKNWGAEHNKTPEEMGVDLFLDVYDLYHSASMDVRVAATQHGVTAAFSVDLLRMPYFFSDRDVTVSEGGKRRKIFHIVRTHARTLSDGRRSFVKSHFRGERAFRWKGYDILITMPGLHHSDLLAAKFGAIDAEADDPPKDTVSQAGMANRIAAHLRGP